MKISYLILLISINLSQTTQNTPPEIDPPITLPGIDVTVPMIMEHWPTLVIGEPLVLENKEAGNA